MNQKSDAASINTAGAPASVEFAGKIGVITLRSQAKRNTLSHNLLHALTEAFARFAEAKIRVVVLRAEPGVKVWSAGHDIGELPLSGIDPLCYADPMEETLRAKSECFPGR